MQLKSLTLAALASTAFAQQNSLISVLQSQPNLSNLTSFLMAAPSVTSMLGSLSNITILAPSNDAFAMLSANQTQMLASNANLTAAVLTYHVLNGTYANITNTSFIHSALMNQPQFANVTGGQVVEATASNGNVTFFSGLLMNSSVTSSMAMNFSGGVIHVIDRILTLPENIATTATALNLTAAVGALTQAKLAQTVDEAHDVTLFVPDNDAFQAIGSAVGNLTMQQVQSILGYHLVAGKVLYSTSLMNNTMYNTSIGTNITVRMEDGNVYVNSARVVLPDVLVANGVIHVIDRVLNPMNATATPNPTTTEVDFSGATSATDVPYTSGVSTTDMPINTGAATSGRNSAAGTSSSSGGAWMPRATGAVGAAALFGGAAVMLM